jgi:hypothetical protein
VKPGLFAGALFILAVAGCRIVPSVSSIDQAEAQRVSDSFMSELVAHHTDAAYDKMESDFTKMVKRADFGPQLEKLFQYCGWPLDSELKQKGSGMKIYPGGRRKPLLKFTYAAATNQHSKGQCFFSVDIVPDGNNLKVTSFGPLKLIEGQLPEELR